MALWLVSLPTLLSHRRSIHSQSSPKYVHVYLQAADYLADDKSVEAIRSAIGNRLGLAAVRPDEFSTDPIHQVCCSPPPLEAHSFSLTETVPASSFPQQMPHFS